MNVALTNHAAERWLERGIPFTVAVERWLSKISASFTNEPQKFNWGKGKRRITIVGARAGDIPVVITVY
jgi:hypothetical protein